MKVLLNLILFLLLNLFLLLFLNLNLILFLRLNLFLLLNLIFPTFGFFIKFKHSSSNVLRSYRQISTQI